ncbi:gp064 [Rhodococcus phage ReqiDocB7]|uniref:gp064 n=1 Tax=Rhodococcus phage ReqiDocB7 TaxID=691966 RepID=UPI0001CDD859|nr:gp064 [Rhodococcus phage ReqiDocB7]ADD80850.1 gp064 [Rhodococcus phage ReqiDocB7]
MTPPAEWPDIYPRDMDNSLVIKAELERNPWVFKCGTHGCHWNTAHPTREKAAEVRDKHLKSSCPLTGESREKVSMTIISRLWSHMDAAVKDVVEGKPGDDATADDHKVWNEKRGAARAFAVALFEMVKPEVESSDEIAKFAMKRYKAIVAGEEVPMPPGTKGQMGSDNLAVQRDKALRNEQKERAKKAPAKKAEPKPQASSNGNHGLDETQLVSIRRGIGAKLPFPSLAKVYKVDVSVIEQIAAEVAAHEAG